MPLYQTIHPNLNTQIYLWKITETEEDLLQGLELTKNATTRLDGMKSISHRKGFLAVRKILKNIGLEDKDLVYSQDGKPHLSIPKNVSITHSFDFSVVAISDQKIGVDLEWSRDKVTQLAHRFCSEHFVPKQYDAIQTAQMYTIIWGIKEVVFKIENHKGISFKDHIVAKPFDLNSQFVDVTLQFFEHPKNYIIQFILVEKYVLVWGWEINNKK